MSKQEADFTKEEIDRMITALSQGHTIATVTNFKQDDLERMYNLAYNYYSSDNYAQAEPIFKLLSLYDALDPRFSLGLAGCYQATGNFERALEIYQLAAAASGLNDPTPLYYASICFINLGKTEEAIAGLEGALAFGDTNKYTDVRKAAKDLLGILMHTSNNQATS